MRNFVINSVLILISTVLGLYLLEVYLAYEEWEIELGTTSRIERAAKAAGADWDDRTKVEVIRDLRKEGKDAFPAMAPSVFVDDNGIPYHDGRLFVFGGISRATTVFCNEMGQWSIYTSDEHGFNNEPGLYRPDKLDVALVGDSFTHGACLPPRKDIASLLRKDGWRTLNLGIGGTGPLIYLAVQREYAKPLRPKHVFWLFYAVDIRDSVYEKVSPTLMRYLKDPAFSEGLIDRQPEIDAFLREFLNTGYQKKLDELTAARQVRREIITKRLIRQGLKLTKLRDRLSHFGGRTLVTEGREGEKLALLKRILTRAKEEVEAWGGKFVFVYLPDWYTYGAKYDTYGIPIDENFLLRQDVLRLVKRLGVPTVDVQARVFDQHPDPVSLYNFRTYGHYTPEGYRLVEKEIARFLKSEDTGGSDRKPEK